MEETYEEVGEIHDPESKKDFQAAYEQLVEKVSHDQNHRDLLLSDQEYNNMQWKKVIKGTMRTDQRVQDFQERKRTKIERLQEENKKKEMEECTFAPMTYSRPN